MENYKQAAELAIMCAYNARSSMSRPVAAELWRMAKEYQAKAAKFNCKRRVDIGEPPQSLRD
jgi:hypothetical protein